MVFHLGFQLLTLRAGWSLAVIIFSLSPQSFRCQSLSSALISFLVGGFVSFFWDRARVHVVGRGVQLRNVLVTATMQTFIRLKSGNGGQEIFLNKWNMSVYPMWPCLHEIFTSWLGWNTAETVGVAVAQTVVPCTVTL